MVQPGIGRTVEGVEQPGSAISVRGTNERVRELEAENARLKSLVGELLVTNQLLREYRDQQAGD
jgi:hypothetical protein